MRKRPDVSNSRGECNCSVNTSQPYVVALIGGARSEISQRVNSVVGVTSLPQISYSSTSVSLSDKTYYRCVDPLKGEQKRSIDHFRVTSHMTNCVFSRHVGGKTKKNKKSF